MSGAWFDVCGVDQHGEAQSIKVWADDLLTARQRVEQQRGWTQVRADVATDGPPAPEPSPPKTRAGGGANLRESRPSVPTWRVAIGVFLGLWLFLVSWLVLGALFGGGTIRIG